MGFAKLHIVVNRMIIPRGRLKQREDAIGLCA